MAPFEADSFSAPIGVRTHLGTIEACVLCALALAAGIAVRPEDPLATQAAFPWPCFAVALVGLRYGFPLALLSVGLLHLGSYAYAMSSGYNAWTVPFEYSVGFAILAIVAGEYRETWGRRLDTVERSNAYRQARLEEFTQTYHVLKLSHDRLEQDNAGNQTSLRSSLLTIRGLFTPGTELAHHAEEVLDLFRRYCAVVSGGFYIVNDGEIAPEPLARVGNLNDQVLKDPLVLAAIAKRSVTSVNPGNPESMVGRAPGDALVVVPFVDSFTTLRGLLIVSELPFFSYTERTLQLMAILGGQIADFTRDRRTFPEGLDVESATFVSETLRSLEYAQEHGLNTTLVTISFADQTSAPAYLETIDKQSRGLDRLLPVGEVGERSALLIMPLTGSEEFGQFLTRFDRYLTDAHGHGAAGLNISAEHMQIHAGTHPRHIAEFIQSRIGQNSVSTAFERFEQRPGIRDTPSTMNRDTPNAV